MIVVSDTSALSNLAIIDHLWLLEAIYQTVIIPDVVARELAAASNPTISAILQLGWIQTQPLTNSELADQLQHLRADPFFNTSKQSALDYLWLRVIRFRRPKNTEYNPCIVWKYCTHKETSIFALVT